MSPDLSPEALATALPGREVRCYPALLSTEADALAWGRAGAPAGSVVVTDYQVSPRGRAGLEWTVVPGRSLGFSLIVRPELPAEREGWLYTVASSGLADHIGEDAVIEWPDDVFLCDERVASVGVNAELGPGRVRWAVLNVLVRRVAGARDLALASTVERIERRLEAAPDGVLEDYLPRCRTIGRRVTARMIPLGPAGPQVTGSAAGALMDGALSIATEEGRRVAVRPQSLGILEVSHGG
ncbi:MAG: biotin--[acetyl-CoA-carboxylase] ligase [Actinomycetota bacterium]